MTVLLSRHRLTLNGLAMGEIELGRLIGVTRVTGFGDAASVFSSEQNVQADGAWGSTAYRGPRAVGLDGFVHADSPYEAEMIIDSINEAAALTDVPLTFHTAAGDKTLFVRRDGAISIDWVEENWFNWSLTLLALDPLLYDGGQGVDDGAIQLQTSLPFTTGGLTFPITFPITFTGSSSSGDLTFNNPRSGGRLDMRIYGAVTNPSVTVENSDGVRTLAWNLTFGIGEYLVIDPAARSSRLQGQVSRPPRLRQWPTLRRGLNTFRFRAGTYQESAQLVVAIRPAN